MPTLPSQLRNRLEAVVKQARRTAEAAAKVALERLTVGAAKPGEHLSDDEQKLRKRLRAHGRQLGDGRDPSGTQSVDHLVRECAYEHWHRMLFARFLAENNLLIHEKEGMPVTLAECDELAVDEGACLPGRQAPDGWTLAARYASRMLPQIFRPDDPVLQVGFAPEHKRALEKLVTELPVEVFTASDSLGWCYQFWQAERKDQINAAGNKIGADELPAVTQLFTEDYMVDFLLDNTLGAWWAGRCAAVSSFKFQVSSCATEEAARKACALPGCPWKYLRFIREGDGDSPAELKTEHLKLKIPPAWKPAAGPFDGWPKTARELKCLDPCMGSGHFVVAMFERLVVLRMAEEKLDEAAAVAAVIRDNLFGLEIDPRCTQIAAFNLGLAAWRRVGHRPLPAMNLACSGFAPNAKLEDWLKLADSQPSTINSEPSDRLRSGMTRLYELFKQAPVLGSLINPRAGEGDLLVAAFHELQPLLEKALAQETKDDTAHEMAVTARGLAKAAEILAGQFTLVATNVPYLGRGNQDDVLKDYCERVHPEAKMDLATCFVERCLDFCISGGSTGLVTPQNWLFLGKYKKMRPTLLNHQTWNTVFQLGESAFESPQAAGAYVALIGLTRQEPRANHQFVGLDVTKEPTPSAKGEALVQRPVSLANQAAQLKHPDSTVSMAGINFTETLGDYIESYHGITTTDFPRFGREFWEQYSMSEDWVFHHGSVEETKHFSGRSGVLLWQNGQGALKELQEAGATVVVTGLEAWGRNGVGINRLRNLNATLYGGTSFDTTIAVLVPCDQKHLTAIWSFCESPEFFKTVRSFNQQVVVEYVYFPKIPFDLAHWQTVAAEKYPHGLPKPFSSDPTQWLFSGHPKGAGISGTSPQPSPQSGEGVALHVAVARLLSYQWPRQTGSSFPDCPALGPDGLETLADDDGIVCIPSVRGEAPAAERLRTLLAAAYGKDWSPAKQDELLSTLNPQPSTLEDWLRNGFFDQHCKLFHHRPFIWQIWDGRKDGFSVLVNYHKLDHKLLEKLTYTYLGEWIKRQQDAVANEESGADLSADGQAGDRLLKAQQFQDKLKLILEGEAPYDIFVRWKPKEQQPIGWHPDLNDGVRLNIRPFMQADVLRKRPNIKWGIDRGKNPPGAPWGEERDNDRHLTLAEKQKAL
jgi:hypothetical protein